MSVTAATIIPTNVEKVPLHHWRPGARLLSVGSRDGADFAGDASSDARSFRRDVTGDLLVAAQRRAGTDGLLACWSASLHEPAGMALLRTHRQGALVVATPGIGDSALLDALLPEVDAWLLLTLAQPGPLAARILEQGRHVEVLMGLDEGANIPDLEWSRASAVHLVARRPAEADLLDDWCDAAREKFPAGTWIYDHHHPHTDCQGCGERLIWRHSGRSRRDEAQVDGRCGKCGAVVPLG